VNLAILPSTIKWYSNEHSGYMVNIDWVGPMP